MAKALVIFLHGVGSNGDDLAPIGRHWATLLPEKEPATGTPLTIIRPSVLLPPWAVNTDMLGIKSLPPTPGATFNPGTA